MIKLSEYRAAERSTRDRYFNPAHLVDFYSDAREFTGGGTDTLTDRHIVTVTVIFTADDSMICVMETPEEILSLIEDSK